MFNKILKYYHTIKYLKPTQIWGRILWLIKIHFLHSIFVKKINKTKNPGSIGQLSLIKKPVLPVRNNLKNLTFNFINFTYTFEDEIDWNNPEFEKLWLYNLHYQDYLLNDAISDENFLTKSQIIQDWIKNNPIDEGNGWEPYPLSLRIVNWIFFYQYYFFYFEQDKSFRDKFLESLYRQAAYLNHFFEFHLLANHLWANIKAMVFAAVFFSQKKWLVKGAALLTKELKEQVDKDGGHYEKSPMYHSIILSDILDIINLIQAAKLNTINNQIDLKSLKNLSSKMLKWLQTMSHPDGKIALLGDSAFMIAPTLEKIEEYYLQLMDKKQESPSQDTFTPMKHSGYFAFRTNDQYLVADGGELGVAYQPGHAHCDYLSYEYSFKGKRFIVDSGVGNYLPTELRQKARSIYAHNALVVNGLDQAEIWKAFRMGRRIAPGRININKDETLFEADYINALNKRFTYRHKRIIHFKDKKYFEISDTVSGKNIVSQENLIHPHPECSITVMEGKIKLSREKLNVFIVFDKKELKAELRNWFHTPTFGKVLEAKVIVLLPLNVETKRSSYFIKPETDLLRIK